MDSIINVNGENVQAIEIILLTTLIALMPSAVVMMTSFTRYIISFSFLRSALGLQQNPPEYGFGGYRFVFNFIYHVPCYQSDPNNGL